ncbi:MAG: phosphoribosylformylglycinamidine synthase II [Anaerolineaceae bacterium]|nr:phosphoribosylformylglycinamidine synthase II [Anaerolineaceae bacterium]
MKNILDYGLANEEYQIILENLKRKPNHVEMGIFSAMWSEHCSYKHTKTLLEKLPSQSDFVVQGPGENAGVVSIDEDWNLVFKVESHNHPSYIAPYDGAATGVGGLIRDVMAMGARPVGVKALLRFGSLEKSEINEMVSKVRQGASDYTQGCRGGLLGEELFTHPSFTSNPLVNVIVLGLAKNSALMKSSAGSPGNLFVYFGKPTESDYVDGASFASKGMEEETEAKPASGDHIIGNELMNATLALIEAGLLEGLQDMGAAGLTSSSFEMTYKSGYGFEMDLDSLPKSSDAIGAYELMLSETQERMLASVTPENLEAVIEILNEYPVLKSAVIGKVIEDKQAVIYQNSEIVAQLPVDFVVDGFKRYALLGSESSKTDQQESVKLEKNFDSVASVQVQTSNNDMLIETRNIEITETETNYGPCSGVILPQIGKVILLRTLSNDVEVLQNPYQSVYDTVSQAYKDLAAQGATPIALSDCLNSGDPHDPQIAFQIEDGMRGLTDACRDLKVPVVGGNVSLYNETNNLPILSQFIIGMVGILDMEETL